jgi:hypothetical protein
MLTATIGVIELPAVTLPGCKVNASFAGGPMVISVFPFDVQPATKRIAIKMVIPSNRADTPPRLNRKSLNITAILFGQSGFQGKRRTELG